MSFALKAKLAVLSFLLALALAYVWRYRNTDFIQGLIHGKDDRPVSIQFDNGTARSTPDPAAEASAAASANAAASAPPPRLTSGFRKCGNGKTTVYTDRLCPPGYKDVVPQGTGTVNVISN
jgi:hypothetical protein